MNLNTDGFLGEMNGLGKSDVIFFRLVFVLKLFWGDGESDRS